MLDLKDIEFDIKNKEIKLLFEGSERSFVIDESFWRFSECCWNWNFKIYDIIDDHLVCYLPIDFIKQECDKIRVLKMERLDDIISFFEIFLYNPKIVLDQSGNEYMEIIDFEREEEFFEGNEGFFISTSALIKLNMRLEKFLISKD